MESVKPIQTQLMVKVWVWDRDSGHKLFNFHDTYREVEIKTPLIGSCKSKSTTHSSSKRCLSP